MKEYRPLVCCIQHPWCSYCRTESRQVPEVPSKGPFTSEADALLHGRNMAHNVYGGSTHVVLVQEREVSDWDFTEASKGKR